MAMDLLPDFKLERSKDLRRTIEPEFIIINQSYDFLKHGTLNSGDIIYDSIKPLHHHFIKIAKNDYKYDSDFSHFVIELIGKHYKRISSLGQRYTSPFLRELSSKGIIPSIYTNSILITILGNYTEEHGGDPVEKEIYNHLGYMVRDLRRMYRLGRNKVILLNDVIDHDKNNELGINKFNVVESRIEMSKVELYAGKF